jgi:alcohol dehydrogenase (NADP+)
MTMKANAYAVLAADKPLTPYTVERRAVGVLDIEIEILYSGICHSDIHQARGEWGNSTFPMVPGHEIVGRVLSVGSQVTKLKVGDMAGVGCMVNSCRTCGSCSQHHEQFCEKGPAYTYNSTEMDRSTPTQGGYSTHVVVTEAFALRVPASMDPAGAAPLLCAGITTYSPLRQWNCKAGDRVAVVGLGGLGHMAVKIAVAMGAHVTMFSTSAAKQADATRPSFCVEHGS